jgi:hypothetical protein
MTGHLRSGHYRTFNLQANVRQNFDALGKSGYSTLDGKTVKSEYFQYVTVKRTERTLPDITGHCPPVSAGGHYRTHSYRSVRMSGTLSGSRRRSKVTT